MRKLLTCLAIAAVAGVMLLATPHRAEAQKQYMENFKERYPALADKVDEKKCGVCHGRSKKMRSDYAHALEEALGDKKVKDPEKIMAALEKVEKVEYEDGMTYKELLDSGQLPPPYSDDK